MLFQNKISASNVKKIILDISLLFSQLFINQNEYQISCMKMISLEISEDFCETFQC